MTENLKKFLEAVSANKELAEKMSKATKEELIAIAKEMGFELTEADFEKPAVQTLDDDELDAVAGGDPCFCAFGGGGEADANDKTCACVIAGYGSTKKGDSRCTCAVGGAGSDAATIY